MSHNGNPKGRSMQTITLPRKWCKYSIDQPACIQAHGFVIAPARYAANKYVIQTQGVNGFKSRACRLASAVTGHKYVNRSRGYTASAAQAEKFYRLFVAGWDASIFGDLEAPK